MNGETSQDIVSGGIFDGESELDFEEEDATEGTDTEAPSADAQKAEEKGADEQPAPEDDADFLTIRYNKADRKLSKKEAIELAQKGANYDHVKAELDSYRSGPIGKAIKAFADEAGMNVEQYAQMMAEQAEAEAERKAIEQLREKYPDAPDDLLKEHVKALRVQNKVKAQSDAEAKLQREWDEALAEYPDIKADAIPQDVHDAISQGKSPIEALRLHEIADLRKQLADLTSAQEAKKKQDDNRARSTGSLASLAKSQDDFMSEFA